MVLSRSGRQNQGEGKNHKQGILTERDRFRYSPLIVEQACTVCFTTVLGLYNYNWAPYTVNIDQHTCMHNSNGNTNMSKQIHNHSYTSLTKQPMNLSKPNLKTVSLRLAAGASFSVWSIYTPKYNNLIELMSVLLEPLPGCVVSRFLVGQ